MSKFETPYHDVVHGVPPELDEHLDEIKQGLSDFIEELGPDALAAKEIELEKTETDNGIISFVDRSIDEYLSKYNRKKVIKIPLDHIQFVPVAGTYTTQTDILFGTDTLQGDVEITGTYFPGGSSAGAAKIIVSYV